MKNIVSWDTVPVVMDLPLAAQISGMAATYLQKLAREGAFPAHKPAGRAWRVGKEELREWLTGVDRHIFKVRDGVDEITLSIGGANPERRIQDYCEQMGWTYLGEVVKPCVAS